MNRTIQRKTVAELNQQATEAVSLGKLDEAKAACRQAFELNPNSAMTCKIAGDIKQAKGKIQAAKKWYKRAIDLQPSLVGAYVQLGNLYSAAEQWSEALFYYQEAIKLNPKLSGSWLEVKLADVWEKLGNFQSAIACYEKAIKHQQENWHIYHKLGKCFHKIGQTSAAMTAYQEAIALNPEIPSVYLHLGEALRTLAQLPEAGMAYLKTIQLESSWQANLSVVYDRLGKTVQLQVRQSGYKQIIGEYRQGIKAIETLEFYERIIQQLEDREYFEGALVFAKIAVEQKPQNSQLSKKLNDILYKQERVEQEMVTYLAQIAREPHFNWYNCYDLWRKLEKHSRVDVAMTLFARLLTENPNASVGLLNLGEAATRQGKIPEAIACYKLFHQQTVQQHLPHLPEAGKLETNKHPDFLIIGAQKGGTTSLYYYLASHPQVIPAIRKEVDFWSWKYAYGLDWYLAHFPPVHQSAYLTGEASPSYLNHPEAATRLKAINPQVKLIVLLRNPVDRAISHYYHWRRLGWEERTLADAIAAERAQLETEPNYWRSEQNYLAAGVYVEFLQKWLKVFPQEQFLILSSEAFYTQTDATLDRVWKFLDLPEHQISDYKKYNSGTHLSTNELMREPLSNYFQPHNQKLEDFLGMKFNWE